MSEEKVVPLALSALVTCGLAAYCVFVNTQTVGLAALAIAGVVVLVMLAVPSAAYDRSSLWQLLAIVPIVIAGAGVCLSEEYIYRTFDSHGIVLLNADGSISESRKEPGTHAKQWGQHSVQFPKEGQRRYFRVQRTDCWTVAGNVFWHVEDGDGAYRQTEGTFCPKEALTQAIEAMPAELLSHAPGQLDKVEAYLLEACRKSIPSIRIDRVAVHELI